MTKFDDKIKLLLAKVEEQQTGLGLKPKANWATNCVFKNKDGTFFNLNTVKETNVLVEALSVLLAKEQLHEQAAKMLGVSVTDFKWDGYSVADWAGDFKKRINMLSYEDKKEVLEKNKQKLKSLVSEEAKTEEELGRIEKLLG